MEGTRFFSWMGRIGIPRTVSCSSFHVDRGIGFGDFLGEEYWAFQIDVCVKTIEKYERFSTQNPMMIFFSVPFFNLPEKEQRVLINWGLHKPSPVFFGFWMVVGT